MHTSKSSAAVQEKVKQTLAPGVAELELSSCASKPASSMASRTLS